MSIPEQPLFSVVIAVFNEAENVRAVTAEVLAALAGRTDFELLYVDDGSTDSTAADIAALKAGGPIRLVRHDRRCGKSAALVTGIRAARGSWIVTMDGDGQNDPKDLIRLLEPGWAAGEPSALVAGIRTRRRDPWSRRVATKFANGLRSRLLGDNCPDTGCGMKAFRRDVFLALPAFEGMHRFLPALFQMYGHPLICRPVEHRPRLAGRSKYTNFGRAVVGISDMAGVAWLRRRTRVPTAVTEG